VTATLAKDLSLGCRLLLLKGRLAPSRRRGITRLPIPLALGALTLLTGPVLFRADYAAAHDWYPKECCGKHDCAPADSVRRKQDGSYVVVSRGVSVMIPITFNQWRKSPDGRVHVCTSEYLLICAFRGPGV
jgi:hypothetical protein